MIITNSSSVTVTISLPSTTTTSYVDNNVMLIVYGPNNEVKTTTNAAAAIVNSNATAGTPGSIILESIPTATDGIYRCKVYHASVVDIDTSSTVSVPASLTLIKDFSIRKVTTVSTATVQG